MQKPRRGPGQARRCPGARMTGKAQSPPPGCGRIVLRLRYAFKGRCARRATRTRESAWLTSTRISPWHLPPANGPAAVSPMGESGTPGPQAGREGARRGRVARMTATGTATAAANGGQQPRRQRITPARFAAAWGRPGLKSRRPTLDEQQREQQRRCTQPDDARPARRRVPAHTEGPHGPARFRAWRSRSVNPQVPAPRRRLRGPALQRPGPGQCWHRRSGYRVPLRR